MYEPYVLLPGEQLRAERISPRDYAANCDVGESERNMNASKQESSGTIYERNVITVGGYDATKRGLSSTEVGDLDAT